MRKLELSVFVMLFSILFSCVEERVEEKENKEEKEAAAPLEEHKQRAYYPIPSPEQMFGFINENGVNYNKELINSPDNIEAYNDPIQKALNFGVYTADLAYAAAYQDIESTVELYKVVKRLGSDMHIEDMMTEEMLQQVQENIENPDSLAMIAGDSYYRAVEYLEKNGQEGKLALMSLGGWIESLNITISAIEDFDPQSNLADRIASQKITFGNLYTYLKKNENELGVKESIKNIQDIRSVFAALEESRSVKSEASEKGKLVFGKGKRIEISKAQFEKLKEAVGNYRSQLVQSPIVEK